MRRGNRKAVFLGLALGMFFAATLACDAQVTNTASGPAPEPAAQSKPELAVEYNYVHSNAPPGSCGCISLNGGSGTFTYPLGARGWSVAGDIHVSHGSTGASGNTSDLTLSAFTAGVRYSPRWKKGRISPFGQVLAGGAFASQSNQGAGNSASESDGAFAMNLGGGLDTSLTPRFSIRVIELDYLLTTFLNGSNNIQNNLRIGTGIVFRFGSRKPPTAR